MPEFTNQLRPKFHLTGDGWINDSYGLTVDKYGIYHVFFQAVPGAKSWDVGIHWGHATSRDLLSWTVQAPVLGPGDGDDGCFSGCVIDTPDGKRIFYTSVVRPDIEMGSVRMAIPHDEGLMSWTKAQPPSRFHNPTTSTWCRCAIPSCGTTEERGG